MTSREIVRRCIEFSDPTRIGLHFETDSCQGRSWPVSDFFCISPDPDPDAPLPAPGMSEWGTPIKVANLMDRALLSGALEEGVMPAVLEHDWSAMDHFAFPNYASATRWRKRIWGQVPFFRCPKKSDT